MEPPGVLHRESPLRRPVAALVTTVTLVLGGELLLGMAFSGLREGSAAIPWWLPELGTLGETVLVYLLLVDVLKYLAVPIALLWVGYAYGRHRSPTAPT